MLENSYCEDIPVLPNCRIGGLDTFGNKICLECAWRHKAILKKVFGQKDLIKECVRMSHTERMTNGIFYYCLTGNQYENTDKLACSECSDLYYNVNGYCTGVYSDRVENCYIYDYRKNCVQCKPDYVLDLQDGECYSQRNGCAAMIGEKCVRCNTSEGFASLGMSSSKSQICSKKEKTQYELYGP